MCFSRATIIYVFINQFIYPLIHNFSQFIDSLYLSLSLASCFSIHPIPNHLSLFGIAYSIRSLLLSNSISFFCNGKMSTETESATVLARGRLAMLTAHLLPSTPESVDDVAALHPQRLSAQLPPASLKGTLTIVDERTGKKYNVEVSQEGTIKATDLKKVSCSFFFSLSLVIMM